MNPLRGCAFLALVASVLLATPTPTSAADLKTKQCSIQVCYKGGVQANPCTISSGSCPVCIKDTGCYDILSDGTCDFNGADCSDVWAGASPDDGGDDDANGTGDANAPTPTPGADGANTPSTNGSADPTGSSKGSLTGSSSADGSAGSGGSDMSVVFGIIGAAIGVIAVAVIFLVLVRRSRANNEDEEIAPTPAATAKAGTGAGPRGRGPSSTTNNVAYAPYAHRNSMNPTTPTNHVIQYYNDNAAPSPHMGSQQQAGFGAAAAPAKTVRPAAAAAAPTFFKGPATGGVMAPQPQAQPQPQPQPQVQPQQPMYQQPAQPVYQQPQQPVYQQPPPQQQYAAPAAPVELSVDPSPRGERRESFEF